MKRSDIWECSNPNIKACIDCDGFIEIHLRYHSQALQSEHAISLAKWILEQCGEYEITNKKITLSPGVYKITGVDEND